MYTNISVYIPAYTQKTALMWLQHLILP